MSQVRAVHPPRPSRPASVFSAASIDTLVADRSYRGFPTQEAYLQALQEWAEEKMYHESGEQLVGFYGTKTVDQILHGQAQDSSKTRKTPRSSVAKLTTVVEGEGAGAGAGSPESTANKASQEKGSRLKKVFGRRRTVV